MKRHLPFSPSIIITAILFGLIGGFGIGAYMVYALAFELIPGVSLTTLIQIHGHIQLLGWTGLFIIGVSLYKLPRLMSAKPLNNKLYNLLIVSLVVGLLSRTSSQLLLTTFPDNVSFRYGATIGGLLESFAIFIYLTLIGPALISYRTNTLALAAAGIKPFLLISLLGWFLYGIINAICAISFSQSSSFLAQLSATDLATETYIHLVLLPTCFAFSISTFPIFLKLRAPSWPIKRISILYLIGTALYLTGYALTAHQIEVFYYLRVVGTLIRFVAIVSLIIEIDLLRLKAPWFKKFRENQDRENRPPRRHASDYGQFGNFEWLLYSAYIWLFIGALTELLYLGNETTHSLSITRHLYLLGFVTHLILGMAVRMIPGFLGKNRIAYQNLVRVSFFLIVIATLSRIAPLLLSQMDNRVFRTAYGISGILALLAICCMAVNIAATLIQNKRPLNQN